MAQTSTARRIAANVRHRMREAGISQTDLAAHLGISQSALSRRLLGQAEFFVNELDKIAAAFDCSVADLMSDAAEDTPTAAAGR